MFTVNSIVINLNAIVWRWLYCSIIIFLLCLNIKIHGMSWVKSKPPSTSLTTTKLYFYSKDIRPKAFFNRACFLTTIWYNHNMCSFIVVWVNFIASFTLCLRMLLHSNTVCSFFLNDCVSLLYLGVIFLFHCFIKNLQGTVRWLLWNSPTPDS